MLSVRGVDEALDQHTGSRCVLLPSDWLATFLGIKLHVLLGINNCCVGCVTLRLTVLPCHTANTTTRGWAGNGVWGEQPQDLGCSWQHADSMHRQDTLGDAGWQRPGCELHMVTLD